MANISEVADRLKNKRGPSSVSFSEKDANIENMPSGGTIGMQNKIRQKMIKEGKSTESQGPTLFDKIGEKLSSAGDEIGEAFPLTRTNPETGQPVPGAWNQRNTQQAVLGALPLLAGLVFGGTRGAAIGGQVGLKAIGDLKKSDEDSFNRAKDLRKLKLDEDKATQSLGMLEFTLKKGAADFGLRKANFDIQQERFQRDKTKDAYERGEKITDKTLKNASDLRREFNALPAVKDMGVINSAYKGIQSVTPTPAGDMSLIFQYMKILDPNSTVREGEYASAEQTRGKFEDVRLQYNKILNGEKLSARQRSDFRKLAASLYDTKLMTYNGIKDQYAGFAKKSRIDPKDIFLQNYEQSGQDRPKEAQDPKIADWAKANGVPYDKAEKHLRSKGYGK